LLKFIQDYVAKCAPKQPKGRFWGRMFGDGIRISRERAGMTVEEAAGLSGK